MKMRAGDHVAVAVIGGTVLLTAALYARLPARIPTHFDLHGVPDGWMTREIGAWLLPAIAACIVLLLRLGGGVLPAAWRDRLAASPTSTVSALTASLLCSLQCVVLYAAIAKPPTVAVSLGLVLGVFWVVLGLVMPRVRRNPWIGIRTAWTLSSDENWARTHRIAGYTFVVAGVLAVLFVIAGYATAAPVLIIGSALIPVVYSFLFARRLPPTS